MSEPESAVRNYLTFLHNGPESEETDRLQTKIQTSDDPVEMLHLAQMVQDLTSGVQQRADFLMHASQWAYDNGIEASAFRALGVSSEVLEVAGFDLEDSHNPPKRRANVRAEVVTDYILRLDEGTEITKTDVQEATGCSRGTATKVCAQLVESKDLAEPTLLAPLAGGIGRALCWTRIG